MAILDRITLKNIFKPGAKPTAAVFANWIDSFWHKNDPINLDQVRGLTEELNNKISTAEKTQILNALKTQEDTWNELKDQTVLKYNDAEQTVASDAVALADPYSGAQHLWRTAAGVVEDGVLVKNIKNILRKRQFEVADIRWWGVTDGPNQGAKIQKALDDIANLDVRELAFFGLKEIQIEKPLIVKKGDLKIDGKNCIISAMDDFEVWNLHQKNSVWITNFISGNTTNKQTWLKATSSHNLRLTDCRFDGMKLGIDLTDCYYTKINSVRFQSVHQAFQFKEATNGFSVTNVNIHGAGIASIIQNCTTGGRISGCGFEDSSGRMVLDRCFGIEISGNYFEGYNENKVDAYITLGKSANYLNVTGISITGNLFYTGAMHAIKMMNVSGISITGNQIGTLHAINVYGESASQKNINYAGNNWEYTPSDQGAIPSEQAKEIVSDFDQGNSSVSPDFNFPIVFNPEIFHARKVENNTHQIGVTPVDAITGVSCLLHKFKSGGVEFKGYLYGSVDILEKSFLANETVKVPFDAFAFGATSGRFISHNTSGGFSEFLWHRNMNSLQRTGNVKEILNELGITISNSEGGFLTITSSKAQFVKVEFKV